MKTCFIKTCFISDELLGGQFLFEILPISLTVKSGENVAKANVSKTLAIETANFFELKNGYKVSCVKILIFC